MAKAHSYRYCWGCSEPLTFDVGGWVCTNRGCAVAVIIKAREPVLFTRGRLPFRKPASIQKSAKSIDGVIQRRNQTITNRYNQNPNCHWCNRRTKLLGLITDPLLATWDHLYSRNNPDRDNSNKHIKVLACLECNHDRVKIELMLLRTRRLIK